MTMEQKQKDDATIRQEQPHMEKKPWDIRPYLAVGLTAILVIFVSLLLFFFLFRFDNITIGTGKIIGSLQGVIFGLVIAYLLRPITRFYANRFRIVLFTTGERSLKQKRIIRAISVACAVLVFLAIISVLLILIVPQLILSVQELILSMNEKLETLMDWIDRLDALTAKSFLAGQIENVAEQGFAWVQNWLQTKVLDSSGEFIVAFTAGVYSALKIIFNFVVGIIVAVYILMTKEHFEGQAKKLIYAVFKPRFGNIVMEVIQKADEVFGGFFIGKIIDSFIIGCICLVCMYVLKMPYAVLISVIIGITNIIPFFGPFIGAIPSVFLIFLTNPIQAIYFLILVFVLQQLDGNIIGPKILGNSVGLSPFWIIFAILLFGGRFGVAGMIFGVPLFALIYYIIKRLAEHFLKKYDMPERTDSYISLHRMDVDTNEIITKEKKRKIVLQPAKRRKEQQMSKQSETEND